MLSAKGTLVVPVQALVRRDLSVCAPKFACAVANAVTACHAVGPSRQFPQGLDLYVYEAERTQELQTRYWELGRTVVPPHKVVTNAQHVMRSHHFWRCAVDMISAKNGWGYGDSDHTDQDELEWIRAVAEEIKPLGLKWGGDWRQRDYPHFYWHEYAVSPTERSFELYYQGTGWDWRRRGLKPIADRYEHEAGLRRVWLEVGAL